MLPLTIIRFGYRPAILVKMDILLNAEKVDAFSAMIHRSKARGVRSPYV
jgi:translation elongation factor EF-4